MELTAGSHVFFGSRQTPFGQLEGNTNVYARARYAFCRLGRRYCPRGHHYVETLDGNVPDT